MMTFNNGLELLNNRRTTAKASKTQRQRTNEALHWQRVPLQVKLKSSAEVIVGRLILVDFHAKGVGFFSPTKISHGREVVLNLQVPRSFYCPAQVLFCAETPRTSTSVFSTVQYSYRIWVRFKFQGPEMEQSVRRYWLELQNGPPGFLSLYPTRTPDPLDPLPHRSGPV